MTTLADVAELVRAPAALSVPGDVVAGAAAAGTLGPRTPALAGASVLLYWAGMAANDWADRELDAVERPERPIPSGRVTPTAALGLAAGLTAAGVGLA
ncbi:UbiA family prenyltransferase, partial [Micromonospora sp. MH99]|uniref:UbiA family prenyltransferase n=1 Tax=Micromonospora sp. MH99 TaxID=1945510 RepID=UPI001F30E809